MIYINTVLINSDYMHACTYPCKLMAMPKRRGWPGPYIHTVHDRIFGDFPVKNTVYTPYMTVCIYGGFLAKSTVCMLCIWLYNWWISCQKCRMYYIYVYILANPTKEWCMKQASLSYVNMTIIAISKSFSRQHTENCTSKSFLNHFPSFLNHFPDSTQKTAPANPALLLPFTLGKRENCTRTEHSSQVLKHSMLHRT